MKKNPKISIITVSYNSSKYIERTIKSIINQTYKNLEYIIVDGKSVDNTLDIIEKYKTKIDVLISEPDKNLYDAMNKGIEKSSGEYLIFMNAGDIIKDDKSLESVIKKSNGEDFIYGETRYINEYGKLKKWHKQTPQQNQISYKSFINGMVVCHQSMIIKKKIVQFYDINTWKVSSDIDWSIRTLKKAKSFYHYKDVFCYYLEGGISNKMRKKSIKERFFISIKHFGLCKTILYQFVIVVKYLKIKAFN